MIRFKKLSFKNFLSIGNNGFTYDFNEGETYLIMGKNGSGKSTIIDALTFALYGKAFRKINKPQLVNSINGKHCEVQIEFETRGRHYEIIRTIKPNRLRVWEDGKELPEQANVHEFQSLITNQILRMSESSFKQLVVLGSKSYKPFMTLDAAERRTVIEDLLDIGIYQSMYAILKKRVSTAEKELELADGKLLEVENSIETSQEYLNRIDGEEGQKHLNKVKENIDRLKANRKKEQAKLSDIMSETLNDDIDRISDEIKSIQKEKDKLEKAEMTMSLQYDHAREELEFFKDNDSCPTCHQSIGEDFKHERINSGNDDISELDIKITKCKNLIDERKKRIITLSDQIGELKDRASDIRFLQNDIENLDKNIADKEQEYEDLKSKTEEDVSFVQNKINELTTKKNELEDQCEELKKQLTSYEYISDLLRDDGIKQQIIQTYLPLINKLIRKFLDIMEFNVDFRFDESFKETIKARGRDNYTYGSFSEGEKLRIDLCLLFTWRELSRMKNSAATNLLILDEIGESSLDDEGFDCFMRIMKAEQDGQCSIIISHSPEKVKPFVSRLYKYKKVGNFSDVEVSGEETIDKPLV